MVISSGQTLDLPIEVALFAENDQLISTNSNMELVVTSLNPLIRISGINKQSSINGVFNFKTMKIFGNPNSSATIKFILYEHLESGKNYQGMIHQIIIFQNLK